MSELPNDLASRIENYLGVMVEQEGAVLPEEPGSRIEQYLLYMIEHGGGGYELPPATEETLGGIKVGSGLSITQDGVLSLALGNADTEEY